MSAWPCWTSRSAAGTADAAPCCWTLRQPATAPFWSQQVQAGLLLAPNLPFQLAASWLNATFALDLGRILKKRLLAGSLMMEIDALCHQGVGQLLGRVMEAQALESLALNGGMATVVAFLELGFAAWILASGAGGAVHLPLPVAWLGATRRRTRR